MNASALWLFCLAAFVLPLTAEEIDAQGSDLPAPIKKSFRKMIPKVNPEKCIWSYDTVTTEYATTCPFDPEDPGLSKVFFKMKESGGRAIAYLEITNQDYDHYITKKIEERAAKHMQKLSGQNKSKIVFFSGKIFLDAQGGHTRYEMEYWNNDDIECSATFDRKGKVLKKGKCGPLKK